jgi:hypothetical protein
MQIVLMNRWFPPPGGGGVAMHNATFAAACARLGHQVTVYTSGEPGVSTLADGVVVYRHPVPVLHRFRHIPLLGRFERSLAMLTYAKQITRLIEASRRQSEAFVIEAADINAEAFFWNSERAPLVIRCHTPTLLLRERTDAALTGGYETHLLVWSENRTLRRANGWTAPSSDMADQIAARIGIPRERIAAIPNALDVNFFSPGSPRTTTDDATILWVGRLDPGKGLDVLTAAIPRVLAQAPRARFVFAGSSRKLRDGRETAEMLRERLASEIARGQVELCGFVPDADLPALYHQADIAVVPSLIYESFSYTCAQPMACALPVVASRIGGIPETLADGECGLLVPPGDAAALADNLLRLIHDPAQRRMMGAVGRMRAASVFAAEQVARETVAYYEQLQVTQ